MRLSEEEFAALLKQGNVREIGTDARRFLLEEERQRHVEALAMAPMTEKHLQAQLLAVAKRLGYLTYHTFNSQRSAPGYPDLTLIRPTGGTLYFLELKQEDEHPTLAQERWLSALGQATGVVSGVVKPSSLQAWVTRLG